MKIYRFLNTFSRSLPLSVDDSGIPLGNGENRPLVAVLVGTLSLFMTFAKSFVRVIAFRPNNFIGEPTYVNFTDMTLLAKTKSTLIEAI